MDATQTPFSVMSSAAPTHECLGHVGGMTRLCSVHRQKLPVFMDGNAINEKIFGKTSMANKVLSPERREGAQSNLVAPVPKFYPLRDIECRTKTSLT